METAFHLLLKAIYEPMRIQQDQDGPAAAPWWPSGTISTCAGIPAGILKPTSPRFAVPADLP